MTFGSQLLGSCSCTLFVLQMFVYLLTVFQKRPLNQFICGFNFEHVKYDILWLLVFCLSFLVYCYLSDFYLLCWLRTFLLNLASDNPNELLLLFLYPEFESQDNNFFLLGFLQKLP